MCKKDVALVLKVLFLVLALALFTVACGSSEPEDEEVSIPLPGGNSLRLDKDGGEVNIETKDGTFHMEGNSEGVDYPEELAKDFPLCPGCKPIQVTNIMGSIGVGIQAEGSLDEAHEFYSEKAKEAGYKEVMNNQMQDVRMFMGQNDAGKTVNLTTALEDGTVMVSLRIMGE